MIRLRHVLSGAKWGLFFGILFTLVALLIVGARGSDIVERAGLIPVILTYIFGATLSGALGGFFRPWLTTRKRAVLLGPLICLPFSVLGVATMQGGFADWKADAWGGLIVGGAMVGVMAGHALWDPTIRIPKTKRDQRTNERKRNLHRG